MSTKRNLTELGRLAGLPANLFRWMWICGGVTALALAGLAIFEDWSWWYVFYAMVVSGVAKGLEVVSKGQSNVPDSDTSIDLDHRPSFSEFASHPLWDKHASEISRSYVFFYIAFIIVIYFLDKPALGWLWIPVIVVGIFAAPLCIAMPVTIFQVFLGTTVGINPLKPLGRLFFMVYSIGGYVLLWIITRYSINAIDMWHN